MARRMEPTTSRSMALWGIEEETGKETGLPLIQCPICNMEKVIELRATTVENMGRLFFKYAPEIYPNPVCTFSEWQKACLKRLREFKFETGEETGLPLIQCPICNMSRVIEVRVDTGKKMGRVFFKCPRNIPDMLGRCMFSERQKDYLKKVHELMLGGRRWEAC